MRMNKDVCVPELLKMITQKIVKKNTHKLVCMFKYLLFVKTIHLKNCYSKSKAQNRIVPRFQLEFVVQ